VAGVVDVFGVVGVNGTVGRVGTELCAVLPSSEGVQPLIPTTRRAASTANGVRGNRERGKRYLKVN
jgi:hypothetical protein